MYKGEKELFLKTTKCPCNVENENANHISQTYIFQALSAYQQIGLKFMLVII